MYTTISMALEIIASALNVCSVRLEQSNLLQSKKRSKCWNELALFAVNAFENCPFNAVVNLLRTLIWSRE